jgi:ribonuclease E
MTQQDMLINYVPGEECRIAITEDGKLEELYTERASDDIHVGNIYRGRVTNVEPSIQAAFIDFGLERNGFLHISDVHPRYFGKGDDTERVGHRTPRKERPPIQACLKRGQTILVQVLKEGIGTKGPTLTSYLSIPGRYLVMMPDMERHGVSRKVDDEDKRKEMRKILDDLDPPKEFGFIVRTAGIGRTKTELKRDLAYLQRLWKTIDRRRKSGNGPAELYRESDLVIRTLRDVLSNDIQRIIIDDADAAKRAKDFLQVAAPRGSQKVLYYDRPIPLFDAFAVEQQIESINSRQVPLPSGGSLVIDSTEAMVTIDVNSGKFRDKGDAESTAYHTNQEAVDEIARQLRLRDLGGVVCLDLIDMYQNKHRRDIERQFRDHLKKDRARTKVLKINEFGLLSLTRQRMRPSLKRSLHQVCPTCDGTAHVKTPESVVLDAMRQLAVVLSSERVVRVELTITPAVGAMLLNRKRHALHKLEQQLGKRVEFNLDQSVRPDEVRLLAFDSRGVELDPEKLPQPTAPTFDASDEVSKDESGEPHIPKEDEAAAAEDEAAIEEESTKQSSEAKAEPEAESDEEQGGGRRRRRRRRRRKKSEDGEGGSGQTGDEATTSRDSGPSEAEKKPEDDGDQKKAKPSPRVFEQQATKDREREPASKEESAEGQAGETASSDNEAKEKPKRRRRRGGRGRKKQTEDAESDETQAEESTSEKSGEPEKSESKSSPRSKPRRRKKSDNQAAEAEGSAEKSESKTSTKEPAASQSDPTDKSDGPASSQQTSREFRPVGPRKRRSRRLISGAVDPVARSEAEAAT